ncbi:related to amidases related to nicotinamidase [Rhynchosporium agropyri]|uniref:Related to amidases related to nicotinamidase n=3 Tax=Rhynchosporium TaxID=38037 RepID=A0A1E1MK15_RHYSE|nr:related to amidases related to nicotinamidase [Rhynchosporium commune]CZT12428.1 related to amidases related to nicotinamidase [Rhynchosporium agropyri]CZT49407.1 related to amidases related to nicotinamidase [Rhynchosporium secalis]
MAKAFRELIGVSPSTASTSDSVLVIIDAQNEYAQGHLKTENVAATRKAISTLLEKYRAASAPLVHIVHQTPSGAPVFTPDTELAKEFSELEPKSGEKLIGKQQPGSFTGTDLEEFLKSTGRNKLVLTGYMAHVCVSTTARQAAERGYDVVIAEDAVGDRNIPGVDAEQLVKVTLAELADAFGSVVKSSSIN